MRSRWTGAAVLAALWALALAIYLRAPARIPTHWNARGEIDRWGSAVSVFILPFAAVMVVALMAVLPRLDPRRANWNRFQPEVRVIVNVLVMFLAWVELATFGSHVFGWKIDEGRSTLAATGVLLMVIGNYLPRIRSNWFFGIRTPWTLSSERVWRETHRVGGRAFVAAGVMVALAMFAPASVADVAVAVTVGAAVVVPVAYSYLAWRREAAGRGEGVR
jgi:uncharacterized membrane protein